jgi:hypothetical protein
LNLLILFRIKGYEASGPAVPQGRIFHSATVCGDQNQYLVIYGGLNPVKNEFLSDMWIVDLSGIVETIASKSKGMPADPVETVKGSNQYNCRWVQIDTSNFASIGSRFLHNACGIKAESNESMSVLIFGGYESNSLDANGIAEINISCKTLEIVEHKQISDDMPDACRGHRIPYHYAIISSQGNVSAEVILSFGGIQSDIKFAIIGEEKYGNEVALDSIGHSLFLHKSKVMELELTMKLLTDDAATEPGSRCPDYWKYMNGDEYEGNLIRAVTDEEPINGTDKKYERHGYGKMTYNNSIEGALSPATYEVLKHEILLNYYYFQILIGIKYIYKGRMDT